ncbi:hypothetical protein CEXT_180991 [Caerostris extrusa]|uniref:Uncharacterized protein n=1 Tax=Caerostris extrusa TaxID=172846 RepID=A0AAV4X914_CAEEX|nr:hypothetical protein CEXT_180991 [Caerostris extrusa]
MKFQREKPHLTATAEPKLIRGPSKGTKKKTRKKRKKRVAAQFPTEKRGRKKKRSLTPFCFFFPFSLLTPFESHLFRYPFPPSSFFFIGQCRGRVKLPARPLLGKLPVLFVSCVMKKRAVMNKKIASTSCQ